MAPETSEATSTHSLSLPPEARSAGRARALLREVLLPAGRDGWLDAAELACTELVANAVLHGHTAVDVTLHLAPDHLLVEVHDRNPMLPVQRAYDSLATTGRGMGLVAALVAEHGIRDAGPDGKTAWFVVRDPVGPSDAGDLLDAWDDSAWHDATRDAMLSSAEEDPQEPTVHVRLLRMPPTLWFAVREHHDAILRELALHLADRPAPAVDLAAADLAAADLARGTVSAALWAVVDARREDHGAAPGGLSTHGDGAGGTPVRAALGPLDLDVTVPVAAVDAFARLQDTLDLAERLAVEGVLFTRPALPEVVAVRDWACEQIVSQHAGGPPVPWGGADQDVFVAPDPGAPPEPAGWDLQHVRDSPRGLAAADHTGRIVAVSRPLARLLGWDPDQLVGRRIVTLVPPGLREAHVAGFTRHLATGDTTILGSPLTLPVLAADGAEVTCRVLIEAAPGPRGGGRYLAWFEAAGPDGAEGTPRDV